MPKSKRKRACKSTVERIGEKLNHVLEENDIVVADWDREVIGCDTVLLAVADENATLGLLGDLDVVCKTAEDFIRDTVIKTDKDHPGL
jgi:hypothetical protein